MADSGSSGQGPATDRDNSPVIDPSSNVIALTRADAKRADDVLSLNMRWSEKYLELQMKRQDDLRVIQERYFDERLKTQQSHEAELRAAEAARLDAINTVNTNAVAEAAKAMAAGQLALAKQLEVTAENVRTTTTGLASTLAASTSALIAPLTKGLAEVQERQYAAQGAKEQSAENLLDRRTGRQQGLSATAIIVSILLFLIGSAITLAIAIATHI